MSGRISPAVRAASRKEKGGTPEDARQKESKMEAVVEARPVGKVSPINIAGFHTESAMRKLGIWLDSLVEKAKEKPVVQMVKLTPELAELLLARNPHNRKINLRTVENFAHEMAGGRWAFNGEPLIVSDTGELNDGQHRCHAVIESGVSIDILLVVGVPRETCTTLDQGRARTVGDYLAMEGMTNANVLGAVAAHVWAYRNRGFLATGSQTRGTKGEVKKTVHDNPGISHSVHFCQTAGVAAVGGLTLVSFCHFVLAGVDKEDADYFIASMISGAGLKYGAPILYARNRLINEGRKMRANEKAELVFRCWNAWKRGSRNTTRVPLSGGELPVLEG